MRVERGKKERGLDGVEVNVMAWSSTTVDVSHMHLSIVCVRGSHVCIKACVLLQGQKVIWCWASPVAWRECWAWLCCEECGWPMDGRKESKWSGWHRDLVVVAGVWAVVSAHTHHCSFPIHPLAHALVAPSVWWVG